MHVGKACANGTAKTTNCATAVDRSDESEPTAWKLIHFIIQLFKELGRREAKGFFEPSPTRDALKLEVGELH